MDKISALMVCYDEDRLPNLNNALECFDAQTHQNKELIVVCNGSKEHYNAVEEALDGFYFDYKVEYRDKKKMKLSLGDIRNIAVILSTGDVIVPWDDDDLNHPHRLKIQYHYMNASNADVCFLSDHLHYFYEKNELFWVNWGYEVPNTMMCKKSCFDNIKYPSLNIHEDSKVASRIRKQYKSCVLEERGYLFTYCFNGTGAFGYNHHMNNIVLGKDLSFMGNIELKLKSLHELRLYKQSFLSDATFMNPHDPLLV